MTKDSLAKLLLGTVVALGPALLSYCQASREADHAAREADAGYKLLVQSVRHLEEVTKMQDAAIILLLTERGKAHAGGVRIESHPLDAGVAPGSAGSAWEPGELVFVPSASGQEVYRTGVTDAYPELPASNAAALQQAE